MFIAITNHGGVDAVRGRKNVVQVSQATKPCLDIFDEDVCPIVKPNMKTTPKHGVGILR